MSFCVHTETRIVVVFMYEMWAWVWQVCATLDLSYLFQHGVMKCWRRTNGDLCEGIAFSDTNDHHGNYRHSKDQIEEAEVWIQADVPSVAFRHVSPLASRNRRHGSEPVQDETLGDPPWPGKTTHTHTHIYIYIHTHCLSACLSVCLSYPVPLLQPISEP